MQFNNYNSVTTNGADLSAQQTGLSQVSLSSPQMQTGGGTNLANMGITDTSTVLNQNQGIGVNGQQGSGFWSKNGGAGLILGGVQVLGNLWNSYQSHKLAKEQMAFAREQWSTNLANQTQTYNTALEDRIRARHNTEGRDARETDAYIEEHSL